MTTETPIIKRNLVISEKSLKEHQKDKQYYEYCIAEIDDDNDCWLLKVSDGGHISCPKIKNFTPAVGMLAKFYGKGTGYTVRGIEIDGHIMFYRTEKEADQDHKEWCESRKRERIEYYNRNVEKYQEDYKNLPKYFQERMDRLIAKSPNDRHDWEPYELFILLQAAGIAKYLKSVEAIEEWKKFSFDKQKEMVPTLDDGHSGNTYGCAVGFAKLFLKENKK